MNIYAQRIAIGLAALLIGFSGGYMARNDTDVSPNEHRMADGRMMHDREMGMHAAMGDMMAGLEGKEGDVFDEAFLAEMIVHHEGAVMMAEAALHHAKHQEIKDLANAIITAQNKEIADMKAWQKAWYNH